MKRKLCSLVFVLTLVVPFASQSNAQSIVDFREAVRSTEPSLMTVVGSQAEPNALPENQADAPDADPQQGPKIELFDLNGQPLDLNRNQRRRDRADFRPSEIKSAAFAVDESIIIAFVGGPTASVTVQNAHGQDAKGEVIALDYVTGLAAIKVDDGHYAGLVVSAAQTEPGMPVIAAWIDNDVLTTDAGMVSTRPVATGSGVGTTPNIDFGSGQQMAGAPVLDASGIVVGVLVPSVNGGLVCARSANILRLVNLATGENPHDLKRGLIGIQFEGGGALVMEVGKESAADQAGIQAGDVVEKVGDMEIQDATDVVAAVAGARAGDALEIVVRRDNEKLAIPVELKEHPQQRFAQSTQSGNGFAMRRAFGLKDGKLVPMEIDPNLNQLPGVQGQFPIEEMLKQFQTPFGPQWRFDNPPMGDSIDGRQSEQSDVEKTLKELQRQMEQLNKKLDD